MPVLLLCRGEKSARDMLSRAIEARYGMNPPVIEQLQIEFQGRARVKLGPVRTWVPLDTRALFQFPAHFRWDYTVKPLKLPVQRGTERFDGVRYYSSRQASGVVESPQIVQTMRRRLWAIAALFLTPLSDMHIELVTCGERCFKARNLQIDDEVTLYLRDDNRLDRVEVEAFNDEVGQWQTLRFAVAENQALVNDLMIPASIRMLWDDNVIYEMRPTSATLNPTLSTKLFALGTQEEAAS